MRYYDLSGPRVKKNTKINPNMQTNDHSNAINVEAVSDYSFVAMDNYPKRLV